jgi:predicted RND superfamily exporter protein
MVQIENDVYSQIGLVMLIGLAAKNAILIVEFAKDEFEKGKPLMDAALEGARLRLRPILMTSFAFILGCVPLWIATGAGAVSRQIMGTTVIGGMLAASVIGIFLIPRDLLSWSKSFRAPRAQRISRSPPPAVAGAGRLIHAAGIISALAGRVLLRLHGRPKLQAPKLADTREVSRAGAAPRRSKPLRSRISNGSRSSRTSKLQR